MSKQPTINFKRLITIAFLLVPLLSSFISTIHVVSIFALGNAFWIAVVLAIVFEVGQLASLMTLAVLDKINKTLVWGIFLLLALMQIVGNIFSTYKFMTLKAVENPAWLDTALSLMDQLTLNDISTDDGKFILALFLGIPIPLISIAFLKSLTDYIKPPSNENIKPIEEDIIEEDNKEKTVKEKDENSGVVGDLIQLK